MNISVVIIGLAVSFFLYWKWKNNRQNGRDILSYIPNIWTSLGILGTFISIYLSLKNINNKDAGTNTIDINKLVTEIIPAFTTSIIGIAGAIVSSIWIKIVIANEDKRDDDEKNTPEHTLSRIETLIEGSIKASQDQTEQITNTLQNQSVIFKEFVDNFIANMDTIFKNMKDSIEKQTEAFGTEQYRKTSELMEHITKNFTENTISILTENQKNFEDVSRNLNNHVTDLATKVDSHFKNLLAGLKGICMQFGESISNFTKGLKENYDFIDKKTAQIVANYNHSALAYTNAVQNAHDLNDKMASVIKANEESLKNQTTTNENVIRIIDTIVQRQEKIERLVVQIQEISTLINVLQKLENQLNRFK
jgi:biopolymer transport protein ExbB/TolQ